MKSYVVSFESTEFEKDHSPEFESLLLVDSFRTVCVYGIEHHDNLFFQALAQLPDYNPNRLE